MGKKRIWFKMFFTFFLVNYVYLTVSTTVQKVLLISLDGFRWDFQNKTDTPNLDWITKHGVTSNYVQNVFPTITLPNHVSIVTGLYAEHHGMITNEMFDPETSETYDMVKKDNPDKWWVNATPIWIDNELQGHHSGVMWWPGYDVVFNGTKPKYIPDEGGRKRNSSPTLLALKRQEVLDASLDRKRGYPFHKPHSLKSIKNRVEQICDWLEKDDVTFAALYLEQPDETAHQTGPDRNASELDVKIRQVDSLIGSIRERLKEANLDNQVNIIITGDHGSVNLSYKKVVKLFDFVNFKKHSRYLSGRTFVMIYPKSGFKEYIYTRLQNQTKSHPFKVYYKEDIPDYFHIKNSPRIGDILVLCEPGWACLPDGLNTAWYSKTNRYWKVGDHGYSNFQRIMNPAFYGFGPVFKSGYRKKVIHMVDLYSLMCHIMELKPRKNDGDFNRIKDVLKDEAI